MVVAVSPPTVESSAPVFVFADETAWRSSDEWNEAVAQRKGGHVFVAVSSEKASVSIKDAAAALEGAASVIIGGAGKGIEYWKEEGFDTALQKFHAAGGVVVALGDAGTLVGSWLRNADGKLARGVGLATDAVIAVCGDKATKEEMLQVVGSAHAQGHERVKGYAIPGGMAEGGAVFLCSGDAPRVEAIGTNVAEASPIPKSRAIGRAVKVRTIHPHDRKVVDLLGQERGEGRWNAALRVAANWLVESNGTTVVSTGAGVSAESGIPTYRDEGGLWELYDQMEVSHIKGFARDPLKCWRFELELHNMLATCGPNAAHRSLADLEKLGVVKTVVTQNVDGLHIAAGSHDVIELHGSETRGICMRKGCRKTLPYVDVFRILGWIRDDGSVTDEAPPLPKRKKARKQGGIYAELTDSSSASSSSEAESNSSKSSGSSSAESRGPVAFEQVCQKLKAKTKDDKALAKMSGGPRCPACKEGLIKPDAVYFGERLRKDLIRRALNLSKEAKGFIIVGTSGSVAPACKLPKIAKQAGGARIIEISPRETDLSDSADLLLLGSAATVLPDLLEAVRRRLEEKHAEKVARSVPEENGDATEKQPLSSDNALKLDEID